MKRMGMGHHLHVRALPENLGMDRPFAMQAALTRDARGNAVVFVVGAGNKAELRPVTATRTLGDKWVVTGGLSRGDRLITQGLGKVKPGLPIRPVPDSTPQHPLADNTSQKILTAAARSRGDNG